MWQLLSLALLPLAVIAGNWLIRERKGMSLSCGSDIMLFLAMCDLAALWNYEFVAAIFDSPLHAQLFRSTLALMVASVLAWLWIAVPTELAVDRAFDEKSGTYTKQLPQFRMALSWGLMIGLFMTHWIIYFMPYRIL